MSALPRGLLSPEERQYAMYQGLLAAGPMLLAAGAPTNAPGYSAQAMAGAGQAFQGGMQGAYQQKMQGLQMEDYMRQREFQSQLPGLLTGAGVDENMAGILSQNPELAAQYLIDIQTRQTDPWANVDLPEGYAPIDPNNPTAGIAPLQGYVPDQSAPKTITTAEGVFVLNGDGSLGQRLGSPTSSGTNVTVNAASPQQTARDMYGDPGPGLIWQTGPDGQAVLDERGAPVAIPYQGGEAYLEQQDAAAAEVASQDRTLNSAENIVGMVDSALDLANGQSFLTPATGIGGAVLGEVPGSRAYNLRSTVESIKANLGFEQLQAMRDASPTGGALGQVAVQELTALQATLANLDPNQEQEQLVANLTKVKEHYNALMDVIRQSQTEAIPTDVDPELWELMTPEQRALWQN